MTYITFNDFLYKRFPLTWAKHKDKNDFILIGAQKLQTEKSSLKEAQKINLYSLARKINKIIREIFGLETRVTFAKVSQNALLDLEGIKIPLKKTIIIQNLNIESLNKSSYTIISSLQIDLPRPTPPYISAKEKQVTQTEFQKIIIDFNYFKNRFLTSLTQELKNALKEIHLLQVIELLLTSSNHSYFDAMQYLNVFANKGNAPYCDVALTTLFHSLKGNLLALPPLLRNVLDSETLLKETHAFLKLEKAELENKLFPKQNFSDTTSTSHKRPSPYLDREKSKKPRTLFFEDATSTVVSNETLDEQSADSFINSLFDSNYK